MNGAAMTSATSAALPPIRRTTTGMNVTTIEMYTPVQRALPASIRKLRRTRAGAQLPSIRETERYRARKRARSVYSGDLRAVAVSEARPRTEAARSRPERAARPVTAGSPGAAPDPAPAGVRPERRGPARPRRGRADHDAAVGGDPDRLGLHA